MYGDDPPKNSGSNQCYTRRVLNLIICETKQFVHNSHPKIERRLESREKTSVGPSSDAQFHSYKFVCATHRLK